MAQKRGKGSFPHQHAPKDDWMTFALVKRKITSVNIRECDDYDMTSHVEEEEEENEEVEGRKKKTKRKFNDYVLESDDMEEEEDVAGSGFPSC
ncbi:hypothetical protein DPEC_G00157830 [Dallia pectoralis]|uniref:Uncharacterized protein n=1 Tax=Dallia pectoralis TaxID=75939 RepID=A0ACC2GLH8_DALPE|nr:hypothetical protein DPEC_G00157830 [Dallia pectoralis]